MQEPIQNLYDSLTAELRENKMKSPQMDSVKEQDLESSFFDSLLSQSPSQKWDLFCKRLDKVLGLALHILKPGKILSNTNRLDIQNCVITVPNFTKNDAVCNEASILCELLIQAGIPTYIFAESYEKEARTFLLSRSKFLFLLSSPHTLLIYNHCVYWSRGNEFLKYARGPIFFRYHNVTPPSFFEPYDPISTFATRKGREQTEYIVKSLDKKITRYIPVSPFNQQELENIGVSKEKISTLAPFHTLKKFETCKINEKLKRELKDVKVNILFVGRIVPNKGFDRLLQTLKSYISFYGSNVRLIFAGALSDNFRDYYEHLRLFINNYRLSSKVRWMGKVSLEDLHTLYACADAFLVLSEHEGFCVPILEAQFHKVPIIAVDSTAIRDTIGEGQLCFSEFHPDLLATALNRVVTDLKLRENLIQAGLRNLETYSLNNLSSQILKLLRPEP